MANATFFQNPDFLTYVRLLRDLHAAIRGGKDESEEGEMIRDRMDDPGSRLSPDEIAGVQQISADFYSLSELPSRVISPRTAEVDNDLAEVSTARSSKDFHRALDLLRRRAASLDPAALAFQRGRIWMEAKEYGIASLFLERAIELDPGNPDYRSVASQVLSFAELHGGGEDASRAMPTLRGAC